MVAERIADAYIELENAFGDLEALRGEEPTQEQMAEACTYLLDRKSAMWQALDSAETHVFDFIERNRP